MFVQVPSLSIWFTPIGMYQQQMWIRWGWQFLVGSGGRLDWKEAVREDRDMCNVFAQEARSFPATGAVNTSLAISSSGWFIRRYRQVMWVYLTQAWSLFMQTRAGWHPPHPALHRVQRNTYIWKNTHSIHEEVWACFAWLCGLFRDCSYLSSWGLIVLSLPLHHELQQSPVNATKSVSVCVWISGLCNYDLTRLLRQKRYDGEIICKSKKKKRDEAFRIKTNKIKMHLHLQHPQGGMLIINKTHILSEKISPPL